MQNVWKKGKTIFDVVDSLEEGDIIIKGANALPIVFIAAKPVTAPPYRAKA